MTDWAAPPALNFDPVNPSYHPASDLWVIAGRQALNQWLMPTYTGLVMEVSRTPPSPRAAPLA